jgi:hypothetical protein
MGHVGRVATDDGFGGLLVERHFADLASLFIACSLHGMQLDLSPDPTSWKAVGEPGRRLLYALNELHPS